MANEVELKITANDQASKVLRKLSGVSVKSFGNVLKAATVAAAAVSALGVASVISAAKLQTGITEVGTLIGKNASEMKSFSEDVKRIMADTGESTENLTKSLFDLVSAGVDASQATEVLAVATELAVAGVTDVSVATDGLTSILNAYSIEAENATEVSDLFFTAQKFGKTTVAELAGAVGRIAPTFAAAGASADEMFAAISAVTLAGVSTNEAVTSLQTTLAGIIDPMASALGAAQNYGIELGAAAVEAKGFTGVLQDIIEGTDGNIAKIQELGFTQESLKAILTLTKDEGSKYLEILDGLSVKSGSTKRAADIMNQTFDRQFQILKGRLNVVLIDLGERLLPSFTDAIIKANQFIKENDENIKFLAMTYGFFIEDILKSIGSIVRLGFEFAKFTGIIERTKLEIAKTKLEIAKIKVDDLQLKFDSLTETAKLGTGGFKAYNKQIIELGTRLIAAKEKVETLQKAQENLNKVPPSPIVAPAVIDTGFRPTAPEGPIFGSEDITDREKERAEELLAIRQDFEKRKIELIQNTTKKEIALVNLAAKKEIDTLKQVGLTETILKDNIGIVNQEREKRISEAIIAQKAEESRKKIEMERSAANILGTLSSALFRLAGSNNKALFEAAKIAAIGQAIINTHVAATKALAAFPPPFGAIAAGIVTVAGFAEVASIKAQTPPPPPRAPEVALADGGIVTEPTIALIGEKGPEKVIPLDRFEQEKSNITLNITFTGAILGDQSQAREFVKMIDEQLFELRNQGDSLAFGTRF